MWKYTLFKLNTTFIIFSLLVVPAGASDDGHSRWRGIFTSAITFGGDDIAEFEVETEDWFGDEDVDTEEIKAGELLMFSGGVLYNSQHFQLQTTAGYYSDGIYAENGDGSFSRWPVEVLTFWKFDNFRIGGGVTYHIDPEFELDLDDFPDEKIEYDNALGGIIQAEYLFNDTMAGNISVGIGLRLTTIEYDVESTTLNLEGKTKHEGNSVGLVFTLIL